MFAEPGNVYVHSNQRGYSVFFSVKQMFPEGQIRLFWDVQCRTVKILQESKVSLKWQILSVFSVSFLQPWMFLCDTLTCTKLTHKGRKHKRKNPSMLHLCPLFKEILQWFTRKRWLIGDMATCGCLVCQLCPWPNITFTYSKSYQWVIWIHMSNCPARHSGRYRWLKLDGLWEIRPTQSISYSFHMHNCITRWIPIYHLWKALGH